MLTCLLGRKIIRLSNRKRGNIVECPPRYVDEVEFASHVPRHVVGETMQFLAYILLKSGAAPAPHFLDLPIGETGQGQGIGSAAAEGVSVDAIDGNALVSGIIQKRRRSFEAGAHIVVGDIVPMSVRERSGEVCVELECVGSEMCDATAQGTDGAMDGVAVDLLVDANTFPTVFLVVQFEGCAIRYHYFG